jgi:hypothetical protein
MLANADEYDLTTVLNKPPLMRRIASTQFLYKLRSFLFCSGIKTRKNQCLPTWIRLIMQTLHLSWVQNWISTFNVVMQVIRRVLSLALCCRTASHFHIARKLILHCFHTCHQHVLSSKRALQIDDLQGPLATIYALKTQFWNNNKVHIMPHLLHKYQAQAVSHRLPTVRPVFNPMSGHVGFVVDIVALGQVFSEYCGLARKFSFRNLLHIH